LRAIQWDDVDFRTGAVTIRRNLPAGAKLLEEAGAPKTRAGERTFRLSRASLTGLDAHRRRQAEERMMTGPIYLNQGLVFCTRWGTVLHSGNVLRRFRQLLKKAGILRRYVVHDLRHTAASVMPVQGITVAEVAAILGHASPAVTAGVYSHLIPRAGRAVLEDVESFYTHLEGGPVGHAVAPPGVAERT
jgi:integrase